MSRSQPDATILTDDSNSEDMNDQRRIQAGRARIEFLDRVLRSKIQKEKKVKQQGRILRRSVQLQLLDFVQPRADDCQQGFQTTKRHSFDETYVESPSERFIEGRVARCEAASRKLVESSKHPEILNNIARFLALEAPPSMKPSSSINSPNRKQRSSSHDEARTRDENRIPLKIFATEYDKDEDDSDDVNDGWLNAEQTQSASCSATNQSHFNGRDEKEIIEDVDEPPVLKSVELSDSKDFIQRNIELAHKAKQILPLTTAEEARLDFLLRESEDENVGEEGEYPWECSEQEDRPSIFMTGQIDSITVDNSICQPIRTNALATVEEGLALSSCTDHTLQQPTLPPLDVNLAANETDEGRQICLQLNEIDKRLNQLMLYRENERCLVDMQLENKVIEEGSNDILDEKVKNDKMSKLNRPRELALKETLQTREECTRLNEINRRLLSIEEESAAQTEAVLQLLNRIQTQIFDGGSKAEDDDTTLSDVTNTIPVLLRREHTLPHSSTWISTNKKSISITFNDATTRPYNQANSTVVGFVCDQSVTEQIRYTRTRPHTTAACTFESRITQDSRFPVIQMNSRSLTARPQFHI
ncbi:hypothetical protein EG68_06146 [Paragonimus skrjabini miyazakii]|uniref:Fibrous sheath-interacting protein 1 n=1 Tax=Paragonimus skrjabini miyazakii TaxID=59628 RepID=A0A8S9YTU1_9TREM|nr:hypothetical protein EG68_06146 [Paragonimus skrjabini miyazakii]